MAQSFEPTRGELRGEPIRLVDQIPVGLNSRAGFSSQANVLTYRSGDPASVQVEWHLSDPSGRPVRPLPLLKALRTPRALVQTPFDERNGALSPDGRWLDYTSTETIRQEIDVQPFPPTGAKTRVSTAGGSPTCRWISPARHWCGSPNAKTSPASSRWTGGISRSTAQDAAGGSRFCPKPTQPYTPRTTTFRTSATSLRPQGAPSSSRRLGSTVSRVCQRRRKSGRRDQAVDGRRGPSLPQVPAGWAPLRVLRPRTQPWHLPRLLHGNNGQFSPDGRWVAYQSNESGTFEIYVQLFPSAGLKWQLSNRGGTAPRWRADGPRAVLHRARWKADGGVRRAVGHHVPSGPAGRALRDRHAA